MTGNVLSRARVKDSMANVFDYRLTILHAGAGYGKTTALSLLVEDYKNVAWYQVSEEDQDPIVFLLHLCYATQLVYPELAGLPTSLLESWDSSRGPLMTQEVIFQYLNAIASGIETPTLIILDDLHLVADVPEIAHMLDHLIGLAPSSLHFIVSTRQILQLPNLFRWRSLGQVYTLDQNLLIFSEAEIEALFSRYYQVDLTQEEIEDLCAVTEGWAISLQLIGQSLNSGSINSVREALALKESPLDSLFELLAIDVLEGQSAEMQTFMRRSSVLRTLTPASCDWLMEIDDSLEMMTYLLNNDLFVASLSEDELRYHPIFQQFLYQQLSSEERAELHKRAAVYYQQQNQPNSAIYHFLSADDYFNAAKLLNTYGGQLHAMGHLDTLANYLDLLSPEALSQFPTLIFYMGDLARLHSRFQEALGWYQQAEGLWREHGQVDGISRALRGQARIYLDTVNPSKAEELLQEALRLSDRITDRQTSARLYQLLAENKLNSGKVEDAERLRAQAELLRQEGPDDSHLWYRVLLRTGRLSEARKQVELRAKEETAEPFNLPRSHRETQLLLSIIYAMQGEAQAAMDSAEEGIRRGKELASPFITAVGYMRQGHAYMLQPGNQGYQRAGELFNQVIEISEELSTPRLRVEAFWGLVRVNGYQGNLEDAQDMAQKGINIAVQAGDEWIASLTRLALGASYILAGEFPQAFEWLDKALRGFQECSDTFGVSAARLWQCYGWFKQEKFEVLSPAMLDLLSVCQQNSYDYLLTRITMLGLPDDKLIVPMLIWARENQVGVDYPERLLGKMELENIRFHPGYQLRVKTLGAFRVWLGNQLIAHKDWRREKTRQLFQLLLTHRNLPLDRDQICEFLWPGTEPAVTQRNFKVALNALYNVLEPNRKAGDESAYVMREGTVYGLRPGSDVWIDVDQFEERIRRAEKLIEQDLEQALIEYEEALRLYAGEFLPNARYLVWSAVEREHLAVLYLQAADKYCEISLRKHRYQQVIEECQRILSQDSCWERAYRHLMTAYDQLGDHGQVARTYQRCQETLQTELNIKPSDETVNLFRDLVKDE
jgi:DNA-binding SARP family transcriptional activator